MHERGGALMEKLVLAMHGLYAWRRVPASEAGYTVMGTPPDTTFKKVDML